MRPLEITLLIFVLFGLIRPFLPRTRLFDWLILATIPINLLHLLLEGYRWQMIPAYGLAGVLSVMAIGRPHSNPSSKRGWQIVGTLLGLILLLIASALPYLLPVPQPLPPTGSYAIGTFNIYRIDENRREIYSDAPNAKRELLIQIWYPAAVDADDEPAPYLYNPDIFGPALANFFELPSFMFNHVNLARVTAVADAPLAAGDEPFPVILFSHGLNGFRGQNTSSIQELASHGYVVATVDHTYGNVVSVFPDGRSIYRSDDLFSEEGDPPHTANQLVRVWAQDLAFVLDEVTQMNDAGEVFDGRLDLSHVGVFGHSTGGGATVEFCVRDGRCTAGLGLDSWLLPVSESIGDKPPSQPFMFISSPLWIGEENAALGQQIFQNLPHSGYTLAIAGAEHFDFTDLPLFSPLTHQLGLTGTIDGELMTEILNRYTLAFFDKTLRGQDDVILTDSLYDEVTLVGNGR